MDPSVDGKMSGCAAFIDLHGKEVAEGEARCDGRPARGRVESWPWSRSVDHLEPEPEPKARLGWRVVNSHSAVILDDQDSEVVEDDGQVMSPATSG